MFEDLHLRTRLKLLSRVRKFSGLNKWTIKPAKALNNTIVSTKYPHRKLVSNDGVNINGMGWSRLTN